MEGTLHIGTHTCVPNWVVASCRYDGLPGIEWHVANDPSKDYRRQVIKDNNDVLPLVSIERPKTGSFQVTNSGVNKLRNVSKIKITRNKFQGFQSFQRNTFRVNEGKNKEAYTMNNSHPGLGKLHNRFEGVL